MPRLTGARVYAKIDLLYYGVDVSETASQVPDNTPSKESDAPNANERPTETFLQVSIRRSRYLVAIAVAAVIFLTLGWMVVHPSAGGEGITLVQSGFVGAIVLLLLIVVSTAIATPICKLDSPHAGMWCAFLGLGGLAIRGGKIGELLHKAQLTGETPQFYKGLAGECVYWLVIVAAADIVGRMVWSKFCVNHWWISRGGVDVDALHQGNNIGAGLPGKKNDPTPVKTMLVEGAIAFVITGVIAYFLMPVFLQSQDKGQVLFGAFVSFGIAAFLARLFTPAADPLAFWIAVPVAAAVAYWMSAADISIASPAMQLNGTTIPSNAKIFPQYSPTAAGRALPIDFVSGGVPGAIMGYYIALRVHLNHVIDKSTKDDDKK